MTYRVSKYRWPTLGFLFCLIGGGLISVWLKQDANWDLMNYHIYNPWAFLDHRANVDLYAAGIQTYFNPTLDIPYYYFAFIALSERPRAVAFLMGLPFGLMVFFTLYSARLVLADLAIAPRARNVVALLAIGFGVTGAATLPQVGTTFNEIHVAALILGGVAALLSGLHRAGPSIPRRSAFWGGRCLVWPPA